MGNLDVIENREHVAPNNMDFDPLPAGMYAAKVTKEELVPTSRGEGLLLKVVHTVCSGQYEGRTIFSNFNVTNPNEKAQQIGRGMLSSMGRACGLPGIPADSSMYLGKLHTIKVVVEPASGVNPTTNEPYPAKNLIKGFFPYGKAAETVPPSPATPAATKTAPPPPSDDDLPDFLKS